MSSADTVTNPYGHAFDSYWHAGWRGILPLPYGKKTYPPAGTTGYNGTDPSYADCYTWADEGPRNIALRLPPTAAGIDVDHYDGKLGGNTLTQLVETYGPLPPTVLCTSRDDGISGIRVYRIPEGTTLPTKMPGIEFIQAHHRYVVAWPSLHPEGRTYRWYDERTGQHLNTAPDIHTLPQLPPAWVTGLATEAKQSEKADIDLAAAAAILAQMPTGDPCDHMLRHAGKAMAGGDRHDSYNEAVLAVVGAGRRGCPGAMITIRRLHDAFIAEIAGPKGRATPSEAEAEWRRSLVGAVAIIADDEQGTVCPDDVYEWIRDQDNSNDQPDTPTPDDTEETPYQRAVRQRYVELRITDDAKQQLAALKAGQAPALDGVNLGTFLAQPDEDTHYRIDSLWPTDGRVMLAAAAKSGKTTIVAANLIPSLVDGRDFLGCHQATPVTGTVAYLNMEVGENTLRRWMRDAHIDNVNQVVVANLRGRATALTLNTDAGRQRFAHWLQSIHAEVVILDPLAPVLAALGLDENSNADVATFYAWWSEALTLGGVRDDVIVHHTGHAGDRSRGASRLLDEPDAIWTLTRDTDDTDDDPLGPISTRYLAAYGRDVDMPALELEYDPTSRHLTITDRTRSATKGNKAEQYIRNIMKDGIPKTRNRICEGASANRNAVWRRLEELIASGDLQIVDKSKRTYVWPDVVTMK